MINQFVQTIELEAGKVLCK